MRLNFTIFVCCIGCFASISNAQFRNSGSLFDNFKQNFGRGSDIVDTVRNIQGGYRDYRSPQHSLPKQTGFVPLPGPRPDNRFKISPELIESGLEMLYYGGRPNWENSGPIDCPWEPPTNIDYPGHQPVNPGYSRQPIGPPTLANAKSKFKAGRYAEAMQILNVVVNKDPKNVSLHPFVSLTLFANREYEQAGVYAFSAVANDLVWDWKTIRSYYGNADYLTEYRNLQHHVRDNKTAPPVRFLLGYHHLMLNHNDHAGRVFTQLQSDMPDNALLAALITKTTGRKSIVKRPANKPGTGNGNKAAAGNAKVSPRIVKARGLYTKAKTEFGKKQYLSALKTIDKVCEIIPDDTNAFQFRSLVKFASYDFQGAAADAFQAITLGNIWNRNTVEMLYGSKGKYEKHLADLESTVADESNMTNHFLLAYHRLISADLQRGEQELQKVLEFQPDEPLTKRLLAVVQAKRKTEMEQVRNAPRK